jgi:hypothetical protein
LAVKNWLFRFSHAKQNLAVRKWRSRARMIDFTKTKLTLIGTETLCQYGIAENVRPVDDPKDPALHTENLSPGNHADNVETPNNDSGTSVSFEPVDDQNRALYSR